MSTESNYSNDRGSSTMSGELNPATGEWSTAANPTGEEASLGADQDEQQLRASIEHTRADMSETIDELQERLNPANVKEMMKERLVEKVQHAKETIMDATLGRVEDMAERMSDTVYETRRGIVEVVKANPIPSAMVGVGLAWLWMNRRDAGSNGNGSSRWQGGSQKSYSMSGGQERWSSSRSGSAFDDERDDFYTSGQSFAGRGEGAMEGAAGETRQTASKIASKARETMHGVTDKAQQTAGYVASARKTSRGAHKTRLVASRRRSFAS